MASDSKDKDIREFFGDSGEQDDAVLEVPVSECRKAFASDTPKVQEAFERHYREGRIGRFAEALDIKIVG